MSPILFVVENKCLIVWRKKVNHEGYSVQSPCFSDKAEFVDFDTV